MLPDGIFTAFLIGVPALFAIVNPIASALIFSQLLAQRTHAERAAIAGRVAVYSFAVLVVSFWAGSYVLGFFGISLAALRIAGGLVVAHQGWQLLTARDSPDRDTEEAAPTRDPRDDAFFPLTIPITTGPGTISVAIALATARPLDSAYGLTYLAGLTLAAAAIAATVWIFNRYVDLIVGRLGASGAGIMMRLSAFILLCLGVQIMLNGIGGLPFLERR